MDSAQSDQLELSTSTTRLARHRFSHRWTIDDFSVMLQDNSSAYPVFKSAEFASPINPQIKLQIDLYPQGMRDPRSSEGYLALFLTMTQILNFDVLLNFKFCLINSAGLKVYNIKYKLPDLYSAAKMTTGWKNTWRKDLILNPVYTVLNNDRLVILCEVTVFEGPISFSLDLAKYMPSIEEVKVASKRQTLMDLSSVFEQGKLTDVAFVVGDDQFFEVIETTAHMSILVAGSPVFEAMFRHDTSERQLGMVTISDMSTEVVEMFVKYLYTGKVAQLEKYATELFVVADKYDTDLLKQMCVQILCSQIATDSVCQLLLLADRHFCAELKRVCIEYITDHATEVMMETEQWQMISQLSDQLKVELFHKLATKRSIV